MGNNISIVMPYYNSMSMIPIQVETWKSYSEEVRKNVKIILVDDGSMESQKLSKILPEDTGIKVELYEVLEDIPWNECGANNLGVTVTDTQWVLRNDIDYFIPKETIEILYNMNLDPSVFYQFAARYFKGPGQPVGDIRTPPNIYLMTKDLFWRCGGYDEDFRGNYGSDLIFRWQVNFKAKHVLLNNCYVEAFLSGSGHTLSRDTTVSGKLYTDKIHGRIPISKDYLRFKWRKVR